ncbi:MAG: AAA family ATPase [Massilia sp.]
MYNHYFQLTHSPFSIAPDPRYLFMSERHREALAHLLYGIGSGGGFVLLTGEIGAGKTTVCRCFIEQVPANCRLAYIFNPRLTAQELLQTVCDELHIEVAPAAAGAGVKGYVDAINRYLLASHAQGLNNVLVIDEAQNLSSDVLEQLRLLTNLETDTQKLLQILLLGQPELREMVAKPELRQLAQRITARYHLGPLGEAETGAYIAHRLAVAGAVGVPFPPALTPLVHRLAHGVPRRINLLCDRALLGAYVENSPQVTRAILRRAAEVFADDPAARRAPRRWPLLAGGALACVALGAVAWQMLPQHATRPAAASVAAVKPAPVVASAPSTPEPVAIPAAAPGAPLPTLENETAAMGALAALWGPSFANLAGADPKAICEAALRANLRCHAGRGGVYELRLLDRPAVVTLHDGSRTGHAVLVGMDERSVTLAQGDRRERVDIAAFVARFGGEFTTFWRMPAAFRDVVAQGDRGPDVDWIAQRLAGLHSATAPALDAPLDARTKEWLRAFQAAQDLQADGVVGPRTYMRLNQLSNVAEPRLLAAGGTGS